MASSKKDMRRAELVVPYHEPDSSKQEGEVGTTLASTLPMMAMFTRNKMIAWVALVFALQQWLAETAESRKRAQTPGYFSVLMSFLGLGSTYLQLFLPQAAPKNNPTGGTGSEAPPPVPPS